MTDSKRSRVIGGILGTLVALLIISPILYCLTSSFYEEAQFYLRPVKLIPAPWDMKNYSEAISTAPILRFIFNSFYTAIVIMTCQLFTGSLAGFAFGCLKFRGQKALFMIFLATMMIPGQAIIISNYLTVAHLGIIDTYWALVLPYLTSAFSVFNMRQAYKSIPLELMESAEIDGASSFQFLIRIGFPLTLPFLGSIGIYSFIMAYNQYLWPLLVVNSRTMRTIQIGIGMLRDEEGSSYGRIMAGTMMALIPSISIFLVGQKTLISGLTAGAIKG